MASLGPLLLHSAKALPDAGFGFLSVETSDLAYGRTTLARQALEQQADWLLWLDADHSFPPDTLTRLLAHRQDVVGINQPQRVAPHSATAVAIDGSPLVTNDATIDLVEVASVGMGVLLVAGAALKGVGFPLFVGGTEDRFFCQRLRSAGFRIFVDQALSLEVGHIGEFEHRF
jgi:GT2 family glycosyltransferase